MLSKLFLVESRLFNNMSDKKVDFNARFDDVMAMVEQEMAIAPTGLLLNYPRCFSVNDPTSCHNPLQCRCEYISVVFDVHVVYYCFANFIILRL